MTDTSSLLAIIESATVIQRGQADVMIAGGVGSRLDLVPMIYRAKEGPSQRNADPQSASRPFDQHRDGTVSGEGAATLILERADYAQARGADILGKITGYSSVCAGSTGPDALENAIYTSIQTAISRLPESRREIGYVNAHGASTIEGDAIEARAIERSLGQTPVTALKSQFGHLGAGAGAVEMAASVLNLASATIPQTLNYQFPDPSCPVRVVSEPAQSNPLPTVLLLNHSNTGQATAVIIERPND